MKTEREIREKQNELEEAYEGSGADEYKHGAEALEWVLK